MIFIFIIYRIWSLFVIFTEQMNELKDYFLLFREKCSRVFI